MLSGVYPQAKSYKNRKIIQCDSLLPFVDATPVSAYASHCLPLCVSNIPLPFSLWYLPLDLALTLNLGWSHFKIFISAKTLCPNKTTFRVSEGLGCRHFWGATIHYSGIRWLSFSSNAYAWSKKKKKRSGRAGESCLFELRFKIKSNSWI